MICGEINLMNNRRLSLDHKVDNLVIDRNQMSFEEPKSAMIPHHRKFNSAYKDPQTSLHSKGEKSALLPEIRSVHSEVARAIMQVSSK